MDYNLSYANTVDIKDKLLSVYTLQGDGMRHFNPAGLTNKPSKYGAQYLKKDTLQKTAAPEVKNVSADGKDDGKISLKEKIKNFGIGIIAPVKNMFSSPKNIAITAASVAGGAALIALTGGAAAPVFVALGIAGGGIQIGKGIYKQVKATTDAEAQQAWQQMGSGTFTVGVSAAGAKASLKASGASNVKDTSVLGAVAKCFKELPSNLSKSVKNAGQNVAGIISKLKTPVVETIIVEPAPVNGSSGSNTSSSAKPVIDVDFVEIVDTPEGLVPVTSSGIEAAEVISKQQTPLLNAPAETPKLTAKPKPLQIEAKPEPLRLEAPKSTDTVTTDIQSSTSKTGFVSKIKNLLKTFGFFTSEK